MHPKLGKVAGYLTVVTWTTYIALTIVNISVPMAHRPVRGELLMMFVALGLMSGVAWVAHVSVRMSTEEREDLYKQGMKDAWSVPPPPQPAQGIAAVLPHQVQRANGRTNA